MFIFLLSIFSVSAFSTGLKLPEPDVRIRLMLMYQSKDSKQVIELTFKSVEDLKKFDATSFNEIFTGEEAKVNISLRAVNEDVSAEFTFQNVACKNVPVKLDALIKTVEKVLTDKK